MKGFVFDTNEIWFVVQIKCQLAQKQSTNFTIEKIIVDSENLTKIIQNNLSLMGPDKKFAKHL